MIIGSGAYRDGVRLEDDPDADGFQSFSELAGACSTTNDFVWVGLRDPFDSELEHAARAFGIHPLAIEDAEQHHERPKVDVFGDTLTIVLRPARYLEDTETVEFGQITILVSPRHVLVVRHGDAIDLTDLRARMERQPEWLRQGPGAVVHAIIDEVVEAYTPVLSGIDDDIGEVEAQVFSDGRESPTQRIYELKREVLEFGKAAVPLADVLGKLKSLDHPVLNDELRRYFADTNDDVRRVVDQITTDRELLNSALEANLTQVGVRQNEDMRKISAWVAILAVPTMIAAIYGMNFEEMPELRFRYAYYIVLGVIVLSCLVLHRIFKRSGWL
ncbi:MAG: magnesium/cobalt transporter CorA [Microthrixaceae bacterium]